MTLAKFGDPKLFEFTCRFLPDRADRSRLPTHGGWSGGEFAITIGGQVLTHHQRADGERQSLHWYLLPVFEWLVNNWVNLFHEEHYCWQDNQSQVAAAATAEALCETIARDSAAYAQVQSWWRRHALRAADDSALYPDLFFRRLGNQIEASWTSRKPAYAPDGFKLFLQPGVATLPVAAITKPLWEAMQWFLEEASRRDLDQGDQADLLNLRQKTSELQKIRLGILEEAYLAPSLMAKVKIARKKTPVKGRSEKVSSEIPALKEICPAVLMYGGVAPDLDESDVEVLMRFIAEHEDKKESPQVSTWVRDLDYPLDRPYQEGYNLAEDLIEDLLLPVAGDKSVDIHAILQDWRIEVDEKELHTDSVRGVAVAGPDYRPAILVNLTHRFNQSREGQRFTLAHELFHILYDRSRAKTLAHSSGPWAPPSIEKRANAFAAMLLMPPALLRQHSEWEPPTIKKAAKTLGVSRGSLIEHLFNLKIITATQQQNLKQSLKEGF